MGLPRSYASVAPLKGDIYLLLLRVMDENFTYDSLSLGFQRLLFVLNCLIYLHKLFLFCFKESNIHLTLFFIIQLGYVTWCKKYVYGRGIPFLNSFHLFRKILWIHLWPFQKNIIEL